MISIKWRYSAMNEQEALNLKLQRSTHQRSSGRSGKHAHLWPQKCVWSCWVVQRYCGGWDEHCSCLAVIRRKDGVNAEHLRKTQSVTWRCHQLNWNSHDSQYMWHLRVGLKRLIFRVFIVCNICILQKISRHSCRSVSALYVGVTVLALTLKDLYWTKNITIGYMTLTWY